MLKVEEKYKTLRMQEIPEKRHANLFIQDIYIIKLYIRYSMYHYFLVGISLNRIS